MPTLDLDAICNPPPTDSYKYEPAPIYRFDDYIALYERHARAEGRTFDPTRFDPEVYRQKSPPPPTVECEKLAWRTFHDAVQLDVQLVVDEETDYVTIVVGSVLNDLFTQYWSKSEQPPLKELVVAFKKLGADDAFLKKIIKRHDRIRSVCEKFDLDKVFKPKAKPKPKAKKAKKEEELPLPTEDEDIIAEDVGEDDRDDDEDEDEDFEGMDVEENEDDDDQAVDDEEFVDMEDDE
jgi:hypothetical protein